MGDRIGRITPAGNVSEFGGGITAGAKPAAIAAGPDGNLWYTVPNDKIGRITPAGVAKNFTVPDVAHGIATGPDKHLYVVGANAITEVVPSADGTTVSTTPIPIPTAGSNPQQITAGPDGNMWFTESGTSKVGRVNLSASPKTITEFDLAPNTGPRGIAVGPDKRIWVAEADAKKVARLNTDGTGYQESASAEPAASDAEGLVAGRDGNMWVTYFNGPAIGRVTPALTFDLFPPNPAPSTGPRFIAAGADGNVWFTDESHNAIGRVTVDKPATGGGGGGGGGGGTGGKDTTRPVLSHLSLSHRTFAVGPQQTTANAARTRPVGTTIRFTSSEAATVSLRIQRKATGRRQGTACRAPSARNRHGKRCTRYVTAGTLKRTATKGANRVAFSGRIGSRRLRPGAYRVAATAKDRAGSATKRTVTAAFTVVR